MTGVRARGRRKVGLIIGVCAGVVVVLLVAGYVTWGMLAAKSHNDEWAHQVHEISKTSSDTSFVTATRDLTAISFESQGTSTCSPDEVEAHLRQALDDLVAAGLGDVPAYITQPIAQQAAEKACATEKEAAFTKSVSDTQVALVVFLKVIGAPDSATSATDGLRGLDGTQVDEFFASRVGDVTMRSRYDGNNGLSVTLTRSQESVDWAAPFGR
jgi:hypothetical protein